MIRPSLIRFGRAACLSAALVCASLALGPSRSAPTGAFAAAPVAAVAPTLSQEWGAVQFVVGPNINAQAFLSPAMNAEGTQAIDLAAMLHIPLDQFPAYQSHPAWIMGAIQGFIREVDQGPQGVYIVESLNDQAGMFDVLGLDPQQEATVITRMDTQPDARVIAASLGRPKPKPAKPVKVPAYLPINPITNHFRLPVNIAGKLSPSTDALPLGCKAPCPPLAQYFSGSPTVYLYQVATTLKTNEIAEGLYWLGVYQTAAAARAVNLKLMTATRLDGRSWAQTDPTTYLDAFARPLRIAAPIVRNEWLRGYFFAHYSGPTSRDCYAIAGARYNNIVMLAEVDNYSDAQHTGAAFCQATNQWPTRVVAALYPLARSYTGPRPH